MSSADARIPPHLRPHPGKPILFQSVILERFSKVHPGLVLMFYVPVVIGFVIFSAVYLTMEYGRLLVLFTAGVLFWSLFEWMFHRFVFHFQPRSAAGFRLQFLIHGVHHQYPKDKERLVMPVAVSAVVAIVMWFLIVSIMSRDAYAFFPGFVFGYLCYDMIHFSIHHFKVPRQPLLKSIWLHHLDHHYRDPGSGFGVSTPVWDLIFGLLPARDRSSDLP